LIAVAMVRRKNLRILKTILFFGLVSGSDISELVDCRLVDEPCAVSSDEVGCDFFRRIGHARSLSSGVGGGGSGVELISPMRRSVRVSCAFVGTPAKSVLHVL
jgi:hypothetical protein